MTASLLFSNCTVWSGRPPRPVAGWMLVQEGRIDAVGTGLAPVADGVRDLAGQWVLPGFVDAHSHMSLGAWLPFAVDGRSLGSRTAVLEAIGKAHRERPNDSWLLVLTADFDRWGAAQPTLREIDEASEHRPLLIVDNNYHRALISTAGLSRLRAGASPSLHPGDVVMRRGQPTGMLWEAATGAALHAALRDLATQMTDEGLFGLLQAEANRHLALGITACHDPLIPPSLQPLMERLAGSTPLRVSWSRVAEDSLLGPAAVAELCPSCGAGPASAKLFMDGAHRCALCLDPVHVLQMTGNAVAKALSGDTSVLRILMNHPARYKKGKYYTPYLRMDPTELTSHLATFAEHGVRPRIHAFGNHAATCACQALVTAGRPGATLEHLMFLSPWDMDIVADSGAVASLQPGFIPRFGPFSMQTKQVPRQHYIPAASLIARGVSVSFSSDHPCGPLDPLHNIRAAVTRRMLDGAVADDREAVSVEAAVRAYTTDGSRAIHGVAGHGLSPGAVADFVIINGPLMDPTTRVVETWVQGQLAWRQN